MKTLEDVLDNLSATIGEPDKQYIKQTVEKDLIQFHPYLGKHIRNTFNLWSGNTELLTNMGLPLDTHPDEVSQKIIIAFWKKLNDE